MKNYVNYMDGVEPSGAFTERLKGLKPSNKPARILRYSALAAALALAVGLGVWAAGSRQEIGQEDPPPAPVAPPAPYAPGYVPTAPEQYDPPELSFADASRLDQVAADYSLGPVSRDIRVEDLIAIFRGREQQLGWPVGTLYGGTVYFTDTGEPCGAMITVTGGDFDLTVELLMGAYVPDCVILPDEAYARAQVSGVQVTALDGIGGDGCQVSFLLDGCGYKAVIHGEHRRELAELFVGRCTDEPLTLSNVQMSWDVAEPVLPTSPDAPAPATPSAELTEPPEAVTPPHEPDR